MGGDISQLLQLGIANVAHVRQPRDGDIAIYAIFRQILKREHVAVLLAHAGESLGLFGPKRPVERSHQVALKFIGIERFWCIALADPV
ncbi:hypothetical protein D3C86_1549820 [compost metagenome]